MSAYTGQVPDTERAPDWRARAACLGRWDEMHPDNNEQEIEAAKKICAGCWVARECFWDALRTGDNQWGIRAGLKASERRAVAEELERRKRVATLAHPLASKPRAAA